MGRRIRCTLREDVYTRLVEYLEREFGDSKAKNLIINAALNEYLQRKEALANPRKAK